MIRHYSIAVFVTLLLSGSNSFAQDSVLNKYGLWVINTVKIYKRTIASDTGKKMQDVKTRIPNAILDLKYAGTDNFMHTKLYPPIQTTYLRSDAVNALVAVQAELKKQNLGIKIWDAYRPYAVTEKMWEPVKDDRYAANPKFGSGHNRGIAVDLTIVDLNTNRELDMGTGFDNFSDTAHQDYKFLPENILQNRALLRSVMEKHGFKALETEWWHFYLPDTKKYELLDLTFEQLSRLQ
jgi:D-alanyl-D-alanine dipeptidase